MGARPAAINMTPVSIHATEKKSSRRKDHPEAKQTDRGQHHADPPRRFEHAEPEGARLEHVASEKDLSNV
jgi:hypothetical protein